MSFRNLVGLPSSPAQSAALPALSPESTLKRFGLSEVGEQVGAVFQKNAGDLIELHIFNSDDKGCVQVDAPRLNQLLRGLYFLLVGSLNCGGILTVTTSVKSGKQLEEISSYFSGAQSHAVIGVQFVLSPLYRPIINMQQYRESDAFSRRLEQIGQDIARLGGVIQASSRGQWSLDYTLYIPCDTTSATGAYRAQEDSFGMELPPTPRYVLTGKETILVVDDDEQLRHAAARILERSGYTVLEAASGLEAEMVLMEREGSVDLMVLDIVMPDKHGGQVMMEMRQLFPDLPVVLSSGFQRDPYISQILMNAEIDFLSKPYSPNDLLASVRRSLDRQV